MKKQIKSKLKESKLLKEQNAITLIALVITIVVILILAGVSIATLIGDNGLLTKANNAKEQTEIANEEEGVLLAVNDAKIKDRYSYKVNEKNLNDALSTQFPNQKITVINNGDVTFTISFEKTSKNYLVDQNGKVEILEKTFLTECTNDNMYKKNTNTIAYDELQNKIIIPSGFKVLIDETTQFIDKSSPKVFEGIVIQDEIGNEFVYVPCGNIKTIDSTFSINLNRYTFDINTGKSLAMNDSTIDNLYKESDNMSHSNTNNIVSFKNSVSLFGGFYIARYEASYGGEISVQGQKIQIPQSKKSTSTRNSNINLEIGMLWNNISQNTADLVCSNMYKGKQFVSANTSLINSYAWDTTLTFIQQICGEYYAVDKTVGNINTDYNIKNTGETLDIACNIFDFADNLCEFTTEYYLETNSNKSVRRGRLLCKR